VNPHIKGKGEDTVYNRVQSGTQKGKEAVSRVRETLIKLKNMSGLEKGLGQAVFSGEYFSFDAWKAGRRQGTRLPVSKLAELSYERGRHRLVWSASLANRGNKFQDNGGVFVRTN